ncbi:MAG: hypothetical protein ACRDQ5_17590 [Sciscionella sp.]
MDVSGNRHQLSSWRLGGYLAGVYLLVCGLLGGLLLVMTGATDSSWPTAGQSTSPTVASGLPSTANTTPSSSRSSDEPIGYQSVTGPAGTGTTIPAGWPSHPQPNDPNAGMEAQDPYDDTRFVRYGGYPTSEPDLLGERVGYENDFLSEHSGYTRLAMRSTSHHGNPAVQWEFEYDDETGVRRHVSVLYWHAGGNEHLVYASSEASDWTRMRSIYDAMVDTATP